MSEEKELKDISGNDKHLSKAEYNEFLRNHLEDIKESNKEINDSARVLLDQIGETLSRAKTILSFDNKELSKEQVFELSDDIEELVVTIRNIMRYVN